MPEQYLDWLIEQHHEQIALIRYHVWWPNSQDPFYLFNISENTARNNFYSNNVAPHLFIDGIDAGSDFEPWEALFSSRMQVPSDWDISIDGSFNISSRTAYLNLDIFLMGTNPVGTEYLRIALVENNIYYNTPYTDIHQQVFRDMIPSASGDIIDIDDYGIYEASFSFHIDDEITTDNCRIVVFIQSSEDNEILQCLKMPFSDLNVTLIDESVTNPERYSLLRNYPNPFNTSTIIQYSLPASEMPASPMIKIYNIMGQMVDEITVPGYNSSGSVVWDASRFSAGIYFAVLNTVHSQYSCKMFPVK